jgi:cytoskeletal protein CcmA (bactofilin family)
VIVPDGASCVLSGATINGNVHVKRNASLSVDTVAPSAVRGNVEADQCLSVLLGGAVTVEGNLHVQHCVADSGYVGPDIRIGKNFECHDNAGRCRAYGGSVAGNVHVKKNTSSSPAEISGNAIGGNLECQGNVPPPTHTAPNTARKKQGQCAESLGF